MSCISAMFLFAVAIPARASAQEHQEGNKHHRYRLVDVGTFGGPESFVFGVGFPPALSSHGTAVGAAATIVPTSIPPFTSPLSICGGIDGTLPFVFHAFSWKDGEVSDLGALPPTADNCSSAVSVNARGEIAGSSENGVFDPIVGIEQFRGVIWKNGRIEDLGTFGGNYSFAAQINNRGQVTGFALNEIPDPLSMFGVVLGVPSAGTQTRAFLWDDGKMHDLGTLGGADAIGIFVNKHGQIAGYSYTNSTPNPSTGFPTADPFLWEHDRMIDLGTLGGTFGLPNALNNRGQVVGFSNLPGDQVSDPFLWDNGKLTDLFTNTIGGNPITANAINDAGEVVGSACFPSGICSAYLRRNGVATNLGTLPGDCFSEAHAINSKGQVVGGSAACDFSTRSFLWDNDTMIDLNTFVPPGSGLQLVDVLSINDRGEISGDLVPPSCKGIPQGQDAQCGHAYVLVPCEEDEMDSKDCRSDDDADRNAASQSNTKSVPKAQTTAPQANLTPSEIRERARAFLASRNRRFRPFPKN
jgi:probable HAF family extracellular repeat protein